MFGRIGAGELVLILAIALVIFGPAKLPQVGSAIGKAINEFKTASNKITKDLEVDVDSAAKDSEASKS